MKIALLGSTDLTLSIAEKLSDMGYTPSCVVSAERKFNISYAPYGKENIRFSDMMSWSNARNIPNHIYKGADDAFMFLKENSCDFGLVAGWYHMVPRKIRDLFTMGCAGIHASLLPRLRGGAPLNWAIIRNLPETGVSLFELGDGVDDGPLYGQKSFPIEDRDAIGNLISKSEKATLQLLEECLPRIESGSLKKYSQSGIPDYGAQRSPEDGKIDWQETAQTIDRLIRAVTQPYPGAFCTLNGKKILIWNAEIYREHGVSATTSQIVRIPESRFPLIMAQDFPMQVRTATYEDGSDALPDLLKNAHKKVV